MLFNRYLTNLLAEIGELIEPYVDLLGLEICVLKGRLDCSEGI